MATPTLPHRTVSSIRAGTQGQGALPAAAAAPVTPHTPISSSHRQSIPSIAFGSPSSLRAEDDLVVVELGTRRLRVGFAGDAAPKKVAAFGPEQQRRVGDFRAWNPPAPQVSAAASSSGGGGGGDGDGWRSRSAGGRAWGFDHELWRLDVRGLDLGLVGDRLERELRDALTKYVCFFSS